MAVGTAVSAAMAMAQQKQARDNQAGMINARNESNIAEAERQKSFQRQSDDIMSGTLDRYQDGNAQQREQQATQNREQALTGAMDTPDVYNPSFGGASAPEVVKGEVARKTAQALSAGKGRARDLAKLGGRKDFGVGNLIDLGRTGGQLGDMRSLARGSAGLLPIEQQTAITNAYSPPSPWLEAGKQVGRGMQSYGAMYGGSPGVGGNPHTDQSWNTMMNRI